MAKTHIGIDGCKRLSRGLESNTSLTRLNLESCKLRAEGAEHLSSALCKNSTLQFLNVARNSIGDKGAIAIGGAIRKNRTLQVAHNSTATFDHAGFRACTNSHAVTLFLADCFAKIAAILLLETWRNVWVMCTGNWYGPQQHWNCRLQVFGNVRRQAQRPPVPTGPHRQQDRSQIGFVTASKVGDLRGILLHSICTATGLFDREDPPLVSVGCFTTLAFLFLFLFQRDPQSFYTAERVTMEALSRFKLPTLLIPAQPRRAAPCLQAVQKIILKPPMGTSPLKPTADLAVIHQCSILS